MIQKLREYIDALFSQAPQTKKTVEVKEEILQNLIDKYNDLIAEGKSEEAAYNIAIASIGDISELIQELKDQQVYSNVDAAPLEEEPEEEKRKRALITAISISLYILSLIPVLIFREPLGAVLMFLMIAAATGLLIYMSMTKKRYATSGDTLMDEIRELRRNSGDRRQVYKSIASALWLITLVIYFLISFTTRAWYITWVIFLVAAAVNQIIKAAFDIKK